MAKINVNTDFETASKAIISQVELLHSSLGRARLDAQALEKKLSTTRFSEAEKTCIRFMNTAMHTDLEDEEARDTLETEWEAQRPAIDSAFDLVLAEAERTDDFRRVLRLLELSSMTDSCVIYVRYLH